MRPCAPINDVADSCPRYFISGGHLGGIASAMSAGAFLMFLADGADVCFGKLRGPSVFTFGGSPSLVPISHVLSVGSFNNVARIEAYTRIASVPSARRRPTAMGKKEDESRDANKLPVYPALSIPRFICRKWPKQALVRGTRFNGPNKPLICGWFRTIIQALHLASFVGTVLGGRALGSAAAFSVYQTKRSMT